MKIFALSVLLGFFCLSKHQESKLLGKYKMEYEEKYHSQNGSIIFNDSIYERKLVNGKVIKGKIVYKEFSIELKDAGTNLQMDFYRGDINKDTIFFGTRNLSNKPADNNEIIINAGKLIRIK